MFLECVCVNLSSINLILSYSVSKAKVLKSMIKNICIHFVFFHDSNIVILPESCSGPLHKNIVKKWVLSWKQVGKHWSTQ